MNIEKMNKLIDFLHDLEEDKFEFNEVVAETDGNSCGTVCCAVGWFPTIFPEETEWYKPVRDGAALKVRIKGEAIGEYDRVAERVLGLPELIAGAQFTPYQYETNPGCISEAVSADHNVYLSSGTSAVELAVCLEHLRDLYIADKDHVIFCADDDMIHSLDHFIEVYDLRHNYAVDGYLELTDLIYKIVLEENWEQQVLEHAPYCGPESTEGPIHDLYVKVKEALKDKAYPHAK